MVGRYFDGVLPAPVDDGPAERRRRGAAGADRRDAPRRRSTGWRIHEAIGAVADFVGAVNGYVTEQEPWKVAKDDSDEGRARLGDDPVHRRRGPARDRGAATTR